MRRLYHSDSGWREGLKLEFKLAKGGLPNKELRVTYSAFANTKGGIILLGVKDNGEVEGVPHIEKRHKELIDILNNSEQVSCNLCARPESIERVVLDGKEILAMDVPMALPQQQPVHLNKNEKQSYIRQQEADVQCTDIDIARMRRNRDVCLMGTYSLDSYIVPHSQLSDINLDTLGKFRNYMRGTALGNQWQHESDEALLRHLQAYRTDRMSGQSGLTLAGLLMFGKHDSIIEMWPSFQLDYFEYENTTDINARWDDRLTNDGTWAGNLYEFFFLVLAKLQTWVRRPFELNRDMTRRDETSAHIAIRETLANAIVHADYWVDAGIRIIKRPEGLKFINPGTLLVNKEALFTELEQISICRNKNLQRMFQILGVVDKAGSGVEKMTKGWFETCMAVPTVEETLNPPRVVWELPCVGLIPRERLDAIIQRVGNDNFRKLSSFEKLVLVCIPPDKYVSHGEIRSILPMHPADLSHYLSVLAEHGYLQTKGRARGMKYSWGEVQQMSQAPEQTSQAKGQATHNQGETSLESAQMTQFNRQMSQAPEQMSQAKGQATHNQGEASLESAQMTQFNRQMSQAPEQMSQAQGQVTHNQGETSLESAQMAQVDEQMSQAPEQISHHQEETLLESGQMPQLPQSVVKVRTSRKASLEEKEQAIIELCRGQWVSMADLIRVLDRDRRTLQRILRPMVHHGLLEVRYPRHQNHPQQSYRARQQEP